MLVRTWAHSGNPDSSPLGCKNLCSGPMKAYGNCGICLERFPFQLGQLWPSIAVSRTCALIVLLSFSVLPPQLGAQKVRIQYDKMTDFAKFKTYAWVPGTPVFDPKLDVYIMDTVIHVLRRNDFAEGSVDSADLLVTYHAATQTDLSVGTAIDPTYAASGGVPSPGQNHWEVGRGGPTHVSKGNLTIEIVDRRTSLPIWTGTAKHTLSDHHDERWNQIEKALNKLFRNFPPQRKGNNRGS